MASLTDLRDRRNHDNSILLAINNNTQRMDELSNLLVPMVSAYQQQAADLTAKEARITLLEERLDMLVGFLEVHGLDPTPVIKKDNKDSL